MRFFLPATMSPGIFRDGSGFQKAPGAAELAPGDKLNRKLIPLDDEAKEAMTKKYGADLVAKLVGPVAAAAAPAPTPAAAPATETAPATTTAPAAAPAVPAGSKGKRAADS
jgi:hypothetical protein